MTGRPATSANRGQHGLGQLPLTRSSNRGDRGRPTSCQPRPGNRLAGAAATPPPPHAGPLRAGPGIRLISIRTCPESRQYCDRKRAEGKKHTQAVPALARRRVNVVWALPHEYRTYQPRTPSHSCPDRSARPPDATSQISSSGLTTTLGSRLPEPCPQTCSSQCYDRADPAPVIKVGSRAVRSVVRTGLDAYERE